MALVAQHAQVRRIERQRALEVLRGTGEVVVAVHRDPAEPGVGRCVVRIDRERLHRPPRGLGRYPSLLDSRPWPVSLAKLRASPSHAGA